MGRYLAQSNTLADLQANPETMAALGQAMYQIRAPQKSTRISYEQLSGAQKNANKEKALQILRATLASSAAAPDQAIESLAKHLYSALAPQKSSNQPWHTRSDFHHAWYVQQATSFILLLQDGMSLAEPPVSGTDQINAGEFSTQTVIGQVKLLEISDTRSLIKSIPASSEKIRELQLKSGESLDQLGDESFETDAGHATTSDPTSLPPINATQQDKVVTNPLVGPLYVIAFLLIVLILTIVVF